MTLYFWKNQLLFRNGKLAKHLDCCCGESGISVCGCDNMPETLYLYDDADDSLITTLTYADPMTNFNGPPPTPVLAGWEDPDYEGGSLEFYCFEADPDPQWCYDDEEGGSSCEDIDGCTGVLATFTGILTGSGTVYVSTEGP